MKLKSYLIAWTLLACALPSFGTTLSEIEQWAQESADAVTMADLESDIARHRLEIVQGESGARWIFGAGIGQFQEPLTDSTSRSYGRVNASAGLRIPLLGSAEASKRQVEDADMVLHLRALQREQKLAQLTRDVRMAYSSYVRNAKKAALARAWLGLEDAAKQVFLARTREHALLEVDRLALQSGFHVARRDLDRYTLAQRSSLAMLRRLSKHALDDMPVQPPAWATQCLNKDALLAELEMRPALTIKRVELDSRERQASLMRWGGMEAGLSLQQSLVKDLDGQNGYGTLLAFDMSMPFELGGRTDMHSSEGQIRLQQARLDLDATRALESEELDAVLGRLHNSQSDLERGKQRLEGSLEGNRIASLRARTMPGDVLEKALMARYELYLSAIDFLDTLQRGEVAQVDALAYGLGCADPGPDPGMELPAGLQEVLAQPLPAPQASLAAHDLSLAWFVWHADTLLKPDVLSLPAYRGRLMVSYTAEQLSAIQSDAASAQYLRQNLQRLHAAGWKVDLVFGDASYVLPAGREQLLQSLRSMASFAFDGLNLDLERSDLPPKLQAQWWPLTLSTLRAVHAESAWPLTLTTHFRELEHAPLQAELQQAGVASVMAMVYVNDLQASAAIAHRILSRQPNLPITLVQSVEAQLPATESGFASGRQANVLRWAELNQRLAAMPNFLGIAVQSLENFNAMEP